MDRKNTKILVISDLHAIVGDNNNSDSRLVFEEEISEFGNGLIDFLQELKREIDIIVCSGDIANKASTRGFEAGWKFLKRIQDELAIPTILCVPGNHDHQSRENKKTFDPKHHLQFVAPSFPFGCLDKNTKFWAWHWCHTEITTLDLNAISLNSSAYHGYGDEHEHGRVSIEVANQISKYVKSDKFEKRGFNLLLCHHHPEKMEYVDADFDHEAMEGGGYLLKELNEADKGPWLIIHGHKHFADITYGRSTVQSTPVIFSAGSLSAYLHKPIQGRTINQFYLLEIDNKKTQDYDRLAGTFEAFSWDMGRGWHPSTVKNLPACGGFGSNIAASKIAADVKGLLNKDTPFLSESDILESLPDLKFSTPADIDKIVTRIEEAGLKVTVQNHRIIEIGVSHE